jgi:hypothetical protein
MDNTINNDIIQKVVIQKTAIYKAIAMLPPIETKDLWEEKNLIEHRKNYENKNVSETNDTMNETKTNSTPNDWRDITDPKLRKRMCNRARYEANKDEIKLSKKRYYEVNKEQINLQRKAYRETNKEKVRLQERMRDGKKRQTNINFKLSKGLRTRLWSAIKDNQKAGSAVKDLGCSIDKLKSYLESKFLPGMSWDNHGQYGWHIDHIKPLSSFDLTDRKQLLEACHYTNLQPLWAKDNLSKSDKISNN